MNPQRDRTILTSLALIVASALGLYGIEVSAEEQQTLIDGVLGATAAAAAVVAGVRAIYLRAKAPAKVESDE